MMGMQTATARLFYDFCPDDHISDDHLLRRIGRSLDLARVRTELKPYYGTIGRPSIDSELMIRILIVATAWASDPSGGYDILDSAPESSFDDPVLLARQICATPIALLGFVASERQWFKAGIGLDVSETPRE